MAGGVGAAVITLERSSSGKKIDASILCLSLDRCVEDIPLHFCQSDDGHIYNCFNLCKTLYKYVYLREHVHSIRVLALAVK